MRSCPCSFARSWTPRFVASSVRSGRCVPHGGRVDQPLCPNSSGPDARARSPAAGRCRLDGRRRRRPRSRCAPPLSPRACVAPFPPPPLTPGGFAPSPSLAPPPEATNAPPPRRHSPAGQSAPPPSWSVRLPPPSISLFLPATRPPVHVADGGTTPESEPNPCVALSIHPCRRRAAAAVAPPPHAPPPLRGRGRKRPRPSCKHQRTARNPSPPAPRRAIDQSWTHARDGGGGVGGWGMYLCSRRGARAAIIATAGHPPPR